MKKDYLERQTVDSTLKNEKIKVTPIYNQKSSGCFGSCSPPSEYNLNQKMNEELSNRIKIESNEATGIKDKIEKRINGLMKIEAEEESNPVLHVDDEDKNLPAPIEMFDNPNVNTLLCDSSKLLMNDVYFVKKDDCNYLQVLVPYKRVATVIGGILNS